MGMQPSAVAASKTEAWPPASESTPVVSVKDVTHRYGKVVALNGISLDIPRGIMVGIVGPDGVGKSTLMALMAGSKKGRGNYQHTVAFQQWKQSGARADHGNWAGYEKASDPVERPG